MPGHKPLPVPQPLPHALRLLFAPGAQLRPHLGVLPYLDLFPLGHRSLGRPLSGVCIMVT